MSGYDRDDAHANAMRASGLGLAWISALVDACRESPDLVAVLDDDGTILGINRMIGGLDPEEAIHRRFDSVALPTHAAELKAAVDRIRRGGSPTRLEVAFEVPDGLPCWLQLSLSPIRREGANPAVVVLGSDVTQRRELEARLRRSEALMVDTQGTAHLGTWEWDPREPHATWSAELYRIYGLTADEYTPTYEAYLTKVHEDDRAHVMAATERVFQKFEPYSHDERIIRPDGSIRYLHTWAHAIVAHDGTLDRLVGVCQDITDRKLAEFALEQRAAELAETNERLRVEMAERARVETLLRRAQKLEAIGRLSGGIAHDLNNVLGVVSGYSSILYERFRADAPERGFLAEVLGAVERGARMIGQLLAFSRERSIARGSVPIDRVVDDLAGLVRRLIGEDVELVLRLSPPDGDGPLLIDGNRSQLEQVVMNLAVNARDAMPGGGTLTIATRRLRLGDDEARAFELPRGDYAELRVSDTGVGIPEEIQAEIFDPFFTTKEEGRGTGLGLSTVYGIAKQGGGTICVDSKPGMGATFTVLFPCARSVAERSEGELAVPMLRGEETVLVVDDQPELRTMIVEVLTSFGYTVIAASDAADALARASTHAGRIDLLLTDVVMPRTSGRELAEALVAARPAVRVVYMSGYAKGGAGARGGDAPGDWLMKPFTPSELTTRIRAELDRAAIG